MGNKAKNLNILQKAGYRVPRLFVVTDIEISKQELDKIIELNFADNELFAIRSSAMLEDGKNKSFAGQFYSEIGVTKTNVYNAFKKVVASFTGLPGHVIIQEFVPSDKAGVIFTNDGNNLMVIDACQGLCKSVVEGNACDEWYVDRHGKILRQFISQSKKPLVYDGILKNQPETRTESLISDEITILVETALRIEILFGSPQDIEWCFYRNELFILQSRPITRINHPRKWVFYDSANIAESYSGIVLPLTHSFASTIYKKVYENLLVASGASRKRISHNQHIFNNMVAEFYGRMYYNMNNWYLMMSFIPGYHRNKSNLEEMLTMNIRVDIPRNVMPTFWLKITYPVIVLGKLLMFQNTINRFSSFVQDTISYYRKQSIEQYTVNECQLAYLYLTKNLLSKFHIPVENDFLMMTYLGILKKKYSEEKLKELIAFENISSKQVTQLAEMSKLFYSIPELAEAIDFCDIERFRWHLMNHPKVKKCYQSYFEIYGGRFANELKLESADIERDYNALMLLIKMYKDFIPDTSKRPQIPKGFAISRFIKYARQREKFRLMRSNAFSIIRRIFNRIGELFAKADLINHSADIFYLTVDEVFEQINFNSHKNLKILVETRKDEYRNYSNIHAPSYFTVPEGEKPLVSNITYNNSNILTGRTCTSGNITGRIRVFSEFEMPKQIDFDIIVARHTDPGWTTLIGLSKGLIIEHGGVLSHAAIVSRELGIPAVIGVENATNILKTGQMVELDATSGQVKLLSNEV